MKDKFFSKTTKTMTLGDIPGLLDIEMAKEKIGEILDTPQATAIRLEFNADLDSIPQITYTVTRNLLPFMEPNRKEKANEKENKDNHSDTY